MTLGDDLYQGDHRTQFDGGALQSSNCVPASLADAAEAVTAGHIDRTGSQVRRLVAISEETNPATPGWSLEDADLAARRLGISLTVTPNDRPGLWDNVGTLRDQGRFVILQGMSSVFTEGCSSRFDGGHCIALPPLTRSDGLWRIGDPLCRDWRWERPSVIRRYAEALSGAGKARYGFTDTVPMVLPDTSTEDDMTIISPVPTATGHVSSSGAVDIWLPDGRKQHVPLSAVKADVTEYAINQSDGKAPKGGPFRRLAEKPYAGWYVASAVVKWSAPPPSGDVTHDVGLTVDGVVKATVEV